MPIISALQKGRQNDQEFKAIMIYGLSFLPAWFKKVWLKAQKHQNAMSEIKKSNLKKGSKWTKYEQKEFEPPFPKDKDKSLF